MARFFSLIKLRKTLLFIVGITVISYVIFSFVIVSRSRLNLEKRAITELNGVQQEIRRKIDVLEEYKKNLSTVISSNNIKKTYVDDHRTTLKAMSLDTSAFPPINYNVHIFYYPWYKSKSFDGKYAHWNHEQLPHWSAKDLSRRRQYVPPDDIGANFYPQLGPYSSADPHVIDEHMKQIRFTGVGVLAVSWYPPHFEKSKETPVDNLMMPLFDSAAKYGLKIAFHIEPYENRSGETLKTVVKYAIDKYGNHSAFYRTNFGGHQLPVYYVYDSYQIDANVWATGLKLGGQHSLRNTKYDGVFLGLLVESNHLHHLTASGFDGFYTYFGTNGFSYGSSWRQWKVLAGKARQSHLTFVPSISPGYLDTRVRTWNAANTRLRLKGQYYRSSFHSAMAVKPHFLSITSFNEWHEGTQVEPAVPKAIKDFTYTDYRPYGPQFYLNMTRQFVKEYTANMTQGLHHHDNGF